MKTEKIGIGMGIVLVLSGFVMAVFVVATLLQIGVINTTQAQIDFFRENYGEDACWTLGGIMLLLIVLAFYEASKKK
ncbi:MAG: hypothetical protein RL687_417 [Candidatus Parcubacteria bacterium]|jgi:hypothetical protein